MKKCISFALFAALIMSLLSPALATDDNVRPGGGSGEYLMTMDAAAFVENDRTYLPVRYVAEPFGIRTSWDSATRTVTLSRGLVTVKLTIGSKTITISESGVTNTVLMDVAPIIRDGRTFLPVRYIADAFGITTMWNSDLQLVKLSESRKSLHFWIGSTDLMVVDGHFLKFHEGNRFSVAYPYTAVLEHSSDTAVSFSFSKLGYGDRLISLTYMPSAGTAFSDKQLSSVVNYLTTDFMTSVTVNYTTFNGEPAILYSVDLLAGGGVYGIALFHGDGLIRFQVVTPEGKWDMIPASKELFDELLPTLTIK